MEEMINKYLTQYYYIGKSSVGNYGIYKFDDAREIKVPTDAQQLIFEINTIFSISIDEIFKFIHNWTLEHKSDINMNFYWKVNSEIHEKFLNDMLLISSKLGYLPKSLHMRYLNITTETKI